MVNGNVTKKCNAQAAQALYELCKRMIDTIDDQLDRVESREIFLALHGQFHESKEAIFKAAKNSRTVQFATRLCTCVLGGCIVLEAFDADANDTYLLWLKNDLTNYCDKVSANVKVKKAA